MKNYTSEFSIFYMAQGENELVNIDKDFTLELSRINRVKICDMKLSII
jgi:hypothetical protein